MKKKILIVEDEIIIAENMRLMIASIGGFEMPDIACSAEEADEYLRNHIPDLILLDIRMGKGKTGIEFADTLNRLDIPFIFITSHGDSTTIKNAVQKDPLGYVVKPVNKPMLHSQLELAFSKIKPDYFYSFRSGHHDIKIQEKNILFIKSDNIYTELHTSDNRYVVRKSTKNILKELNIDFIQVHRGYFVNPEYIIETNAVIKLSSGHEIPLSRTYRNAVIQRIFGRE